MPISTIRGTIDRRILVNYRVDPQALARILPPPFRPQLVNGFGIAGICLIRLKQLRPRWSPFAAGISSENAAHRMAVEWDVAGETQTGVFIPRRDTSSFLNAAAGGRLFPGTHHRAHFDVQEGGDRFYVAMESCDDSARVLVDGHIAAELPSASIFPSLPDVSEFFASGSLGYSPRSAGRFDGLELRSFNWHVDPLAIDHLESSFFADETVFPAGSITFDCALLMRGIDHEWHSRESLFCAGA